MTSPNHLQLTRVLNIQTKQGDTRYFHFFYGMQQVISAQLCLLRVHIYFQEEFERLHQKKKKITVNVDVTYI